MKCNVECLEHTYRLFSDILTLNSEESMVTHCTIVTLGMSTYTVFSVGSILCIAREGRGWSCHRPLPPPPILTYVGLPVYPYSFAPTKDQ